MSNEHCPGCGGQDGCPGLPVAEPGGAIHVIREAELRYLSLDLWPGPYGGIISPSRAGELPEISLHDREKPDG